MLSRTNRWSLALAIPFLAAPALAQPLTTAFTFQGELGSGGQPASGTFDFEFRLFDSAGGITQLGPTLCSDNLPVENGRFAVSLDFGPQFNGTQRHLEILVRQDSGLDCVTTSGYTTLSPRHPLTAAPHAAFALSAANTASFGGQPASYYTNAANLTSGTFDNARLPVPFALSGNVQGGTTQLLNVTNTNINYGVGINSTASGIGLKARSTATSGVTYGAQIESNSQAGTGLLVTANNGEYGIRAIATGQNSIAISAEATHQSGAPAAIFGSGQSPSSIGVYGYGGLHGVFAHSHAPGSQALAATAPADGFAGYFNGRGYFSDKLGIGTNNPAANLHVTGDILAGALNEEWLFHTRSSNGGDFLHITDRQAGTPQFQRGLAIHSNGGVGIGTTVPARKLHVADTSITSARFENSSTTATVVEHYNTSNGAIWELGVAGTTPPFPGMVVPFAVVNGSMYLAKQGQPRPGLAIDPTGTVRGLSFQGVTLHAGTLSWTDAVAVSGRGNTHGIFGSTPSTISTAYGVYGVTSAATSPWAVFADGKLGGNGTKSFRIDHPQDPQNKYLLHYCAESPEVINFYSGTVLLDQEGEAEVTLPAYFASINKDPRYDLTPIGAPMPMLHIASEIDLSSLALAAKAEPGQPIPAVSFRIAGGAPNAKVSWEVKAVRNDRWMQAHGAPVEQDKEGGERGRYQRPELYNQPATMLPSTHPNNPDYTAPALTGPPPGASVPGTNAAPAAH
jgi:hypothetical protein